MNLLELANRLLTGTVAKAEVPPEDPDKPTPGATGKEELEAARQEAASGQQAQADAAGPEGEGGAPPTGAEGAAGEEGAAGAEGAGAPPKPEEEESPVEKAEILKSMQFLAEQYGITSEEVAKAFTGLEGDPSAGKEPLGKGVEYLEGLLKKQGDILERIASFLQELSAHTVKMGDQVAKSLEAAEAAQALASGTAAKVEALPKTAPAKAPKAASAEEIVAKAETMAAGNTQKLNGQDLFKMALDPKCPLTPQDMARANRASQGTVGS
jgi:hypothetical protein